MTPLPRGSEFRFEKQRRDSVVTLVNGELVKGCFFTADGTTRHVGAERIADLLNSESGFFPFEIDHGEHPRTVLYNRAHIISASIFDDEAKRDPGYALATPRAVSILLSNGQRVDGAIRIYRPAGHDRLSDWTRQPEIFRYVESDVVTLIVNAAHIISVTEVPGS